MALNYNFINDVSKEVKDELGSRQTKYWGPASSERSLEWNYQKTCYLILTSLKTETVEQAWRPPLKRKDPAQPTTSIDVQAWPPANDSIETVGITTSTEQDRIKNPTKSILELYGPDYTKSNGVIQGAVLNSAEISSDGTYGSILRITVNFTVFDVNELDRYIKNFLTPGQDIGLQYGWVLNNETNVNKGKIRGTVFNFSFSAKEDGSWQCILHAIGPSSMTYGFNLDQQGLNKETSLLESNTLHLQEVFKYLIDVTDLDNETKPLISGHKTCKIRPVAGALHSANPLLFTKGAASNNSKIASKYSGINTYIFDLPVDKSITMGSWASIAVETIIGGFGYTANVEEQSNNSKETYITLRDLINLINVHINSTLEKNLPLYTFNGFDENGNILNDDICLISSNPFFLGTGPADFTKFTFTTQTNGASVTNFNFNISSDVGTSKQTGNQKIADLVLINVKFLYSEINTILNNNKNITDKKVISFLNSLFQQLETDTGGHINLTIIDSPKNKTTGKSEYIQILNQNYIPSTAILPPFSIPALSKGSIVRNINIESNVPDAIQTEIATYVRAGESYIGNSGNIADVQESLKNLRARLFDLNNNFMDNIEVSDKITQASLSSWQSQIRGIYRKMYNISQGGVLAGNGSSISSYSLIDLKTAIYPIKLKITLDGIEGFQYGNAITTNWLPKQYRDKKVYWTVVKIRHTISNNDWITELETIYRVIS
jgi:hypothetical protein